MKRIFTLLVAALLVGTGAAHAQSDIVRLTAATNGSVISMAANDGALNIRDDDSQGAGAPDAGYPMRGIDYHVVVEGNCNGENRMAIAITELSVHCLDTIYIYDGGSTAAPLIKKFNSDYGGVSEGDIIFVTPTNASNLVTVRFRTDDLSNPERTNLDCFKNATVGKGFSMNVHCRKPCEDGEPVINEVFYRTRNGVVYDSSRIREITLLDTIWVDEDDHDAGYNGVDTIRFMGANLCIGDGVIFKGHGEFTNRYGYYTPADERTYFKWDMGNENDSIDGVGVTQVEYDQYQNTGCFDVALTMVDEFGCVSGVIAQVKVRTAFNPLKTIFTIADVCNNTERAVTMGYDGDNATLTLRKIEAEQVVSKVYDALTFIPDGCNCSQNPAFTADYFEAPVTFTEFPNNRRITSAKDICSICVNMEHSYIGDFYLTIVCPTNQEAILKFGSPSSCNPTGIYTRPSDDPTYTGANANGGSTGSSTYFGYPTETGNEARCDAPVQNPYGVGMDYCFSRDTNYTLITGENAAAVWTSTVYRPAGQFYIGDSYPFNQIAVSAAPPPAQPMPATYTNPVTGVTTSWGSYAGQVPTLLTYGNTRVPSDHEGKTNYYLPYSTFQELIGCPLNGEWKMRVYDTFGSDNGWIFNWSLDICNVSMDQDCKYNVGIDSLVWRPAPGHEDYDLGHYRGLVVRRETPTLSYLSSPDTAGFFPIDVLLYDEFGCVWDTTTSITTYWSPEPDLGPDTTLCGVATMTLDARDRHSELPTENYTYLWNPFGETSSTIETSSDGENVGDVTYVVQVKNTRRNTVCTTRDTIFIRQRKQPYPVFEPEPFTFEGCAPLTLTFNNTSVNTDRHFWDFGDGITSEFQSPTHTFAEGVYTLKYYALSDEGCIDSVVSPNGIVVFPTPKAGFIWEPVYPSVLNPVVQFTNTTAPHTGNTEYRWELQYNRDNTLSVHTLTSRNPSFDYSTYAGDELSGSYAVRLIAFTDNLSPRGNVIYCRDTAENMILIVNDFLQFPNVVTPNGDGINDRFVIVNLLDGIGYPINQLDIYNRWGTRVYHMENISSDEDFWDPSDLPAGTYFYRFSARGYSGNIEHNGAIEVIK